MPFSREIRRLLFVLLAAFTFVGFAAGYWALFGQDSLLLRADNPRIIENEVRIVRGEIYDADGVLLVDSIIDEVGRVRRNYLFPEMNSVTGYYNLRYGVSGVESAYDTLLSGRNDLAAWQQRLMHTQQMGSDIMLTVDLDIQQTLWEAMQGQQGAAVVVSVPDGRVLALVSMPTFDPNRLNEQWDELTAAESKPFFNRVLQGQYQPGGVMETSLMMGALLDGQRLDLPIANGTASLPLGDLDITCAARLPVMPASLSEGYAFACPRPFAALGDTLGESNLQQIFDQFSSLQDYVLLPNSALTSAYSDSTPSGSTPATLLENVLGQGDLTGTPLSIAMISAAIANNGNSPSPYLVMATRQPNSTEWIPFDAVRPDIPVTTASTARQMQDLMRYNVVNGAAQNAGRPNLDIGGHASLAYSGDTSLAWFTGFTTLGGQRGAAIAVVLENSSDVGLAADIGGTTLASVHNAVSQPP